MSIKRYFSNADNTITNAFKANLTTRGTGSNAGASDILEVFAIFGQASSGSLEKSRALINFDISKIKKDRDKFKSYLELNKIPNAIYYPLPLHLQNCFKFLDPIPPNNLLTILSIL